MAQGLSEVHTKWHRAQLFLPVLWHCLELNRDIPAVALSAIWKYPVSYNTFALAEPMERCKHRTNLVQSIRFSLYHIPNRYSSIVKQRLFDNWNNFEQPSTFVILNAAKTFCMLWDRQYPWLHLLNRTEQSTKSNTINCKEPCIRFVLDRP